MKSVTVIHSNLGNVFSVCEAIRELGCSVELTTDPQKIAQANYVIFPGVGAFPSGMRFIRENRIDIALREYVTTHRPLLGICLGMHMLFERGHEFETTNGMGFFSGEIEKIPSQDQSGRKIIVPHMGWSKIRFGSVQMPVLKNCADDSHVYFAHSYFHPSSRSSNMILASTNYSSIEISAVVQHENIFGFQFHPEKSGKVGLQLLRNFLSL